MKENSGQLLPPGTYGIGLAAACAPPGPPKLIVSLGRVMNSNKRFSLESFFFNKLSKKCVGQLGVKEKVKKKSTIRDPLNANCGDGWMRKAAWSLCDSLSSHVITLVLSPTEK